MATAPRTPTTQFSTYPLVELRDLWQREAITPEQMIGYLLLNVMALEARVHQLERAAEVHRFVPVTPRT